MINIDGMLDIFYSLEEGRPADNIVAKDKAVLNHLIDAGVTLKDITSMIMNERLENGLSFDSIPDRFWDGSLLKRDIFYFHKELEILSPPSTWDEDKPFYLEMKITYDYQDALDYFIKSNNIREEWINENKEMGSIKYMLSDFKKYNFIEPIDFFLHLCDYAEAKGNKGQSVFDLNVYEIECAQYLEADIANARLHNKDKIVWRE